ncbi:class I SAM-dependent methyltransferase [Williamsia deligens]|uniref:Class I SAM-dependent methyltransferase n=1 Tax=Williamsia deligens TaxID=321325 RepID=A0ABW3G3B0_9NOCA|nr:class I SAM-dependent methyltransferase [Williamsia deligens]MCP2194523.1 Methyltransferase domain [Williamsia deligens]
MSALPQRVKSVSNLAAFYVKNPSRLGEVGKWASHRGRTTLELRLPWWNYQAIEAVERLLSSSSKVYEYGGGGSTLWLCDRGAQVITVEHDADWAKVLRDVIPDGATVKFIPPAASGAVSSKSTPGVFYDDYVQSIRDHADRSFDLVIVDGRARVSCVQEAACKVRKGGALLLDDSDRPQYAIAGEILNDWYRSDYRGAKPGGGGTVVTSVWQRP